MAPPVEGEAEEVATIRSSITWSMSAVTVTLIAASLGIRLASRGGDVPGWDILSAADGLWYVATMSCHDLVGTIRATWDLERWYNFGPKLIAVLLPGALTWWHPWPYWAVVVTAVSVATALTLLVIALGLGTAWWIVGLAWAASPAFVSHTVTGLGHVTAILPHALALTIVLRTRRRPLLTVALCGLEYGLAWQVQDLGRTAFVVFLAAAVSLGAPWLTRIVWLIAGIAQGWDAWAHPTAQRAWSQVAMPSVIQLVSTIGEAARVLIISHWSDLPILIVTGLLALLVLRRDRMFWGLVTLAQLGVVLVIALRRGPICLYPRRILVLDFYAVAVVAALWSQRPRCQPWLVAVLLVGTCWQLAQAVVFARAPRGDYGFPLPYTNTTSTYDYHVVYQDVDWARAIAEDVAAGRHVFLLSNKLTYPENCSNPSGVVERVALTVGWAAYNDRLLWFGRPGGVCFTHFGPRDITTVDDAVASITEPQNWVVWDARHPNDATHNQPEQERERAAIRGALERRFLLVPTPVAELRPGRSTITRYVLRPIQAGMREDGAK